MAGRAADQAAQQLDRFVGAAELGTNAAQMQVGVGVRRVERQALTRLALRLDEAPRNREHRTQLEAQAGVVRGSVDRVAHNSVPAGTAAMPALDARPTSGAAWAAR